MRAFEQAWALLKALPEQRMINPLGEYQQQTIQPPIAGMLSRHLGMTPAAAVESGALEMASVPRTYHTQFPPKDGKMVGENYFDVPEANIFPGITEASDYRTQSMADEPKMSQFYREKGTPHQELRGGKVAEFERRAGRKVLPGDRV